MCTLVDFLKRCLSYCYQCTLTDSELRGQRRWLKLMLTAVILFAEVQGGALQICCVLSLFADYLLMNTLIIHNVVTIAGSFTTVR